MKNSLKYARVLEEAGLSRETAEAHIFILAEVLGDEMATKKDIAELKYELKALEYRMTLKLGGLMAAFLATALTAAKLLFVG